MPAAPNQDEPCDATLIESQKGEQPRPTNWRDLVDNRWSMLLMLFFVTAALGLPLLWASRAFSTVAKIVLTVVVLAWTALVLWVFWLIMAWCYGQIAEAMGW